MAENKIEHATKPSGNAAEPWKLFIVMKNGKPFKAFIFEDDAAECIDRYKTITPSDVFTTAVLSGDALPFNPPPGAVYKVDGVEKITLPGDEITTEEMGVDLRSFMAY